MDDRFCAMDEVDQTNVIWNRMIALGNDAVTPSTSQRGGLVVWLPDALVTG